MFDRLVKLFDLIQQKDREWRAWFFSHIAVPAVVMGYLISGLSPISPLSVFEDGISIVSLSSSKLGTSRAREENGAVVILDPVDLDVSIPWRDRSDGDVNLRSSLESALYASNDGRLRVDDHGLTIQLPLLGVSEPLVLVIDQELGEQVYLPGKKIRTAALAPSPRQSVGLALWAIIGGMFGIGLSLGLSTLGTIEPEK